MVSSAPPRYRYAVNRHDAITSVNQLWLAFARENGAPQLSGEAVTGRCLWDFIDGVETQRLYREIVQRVRLDILRVVVPFRCDSPTLRRYMRLEITRQPEGCVQFDGVLERVEPTTRLNLLDPAMPRSPDALTLCSCCKRVLIEPVGWLEIEDVAVRLHLLEEQKVPALRNTVCPECLAAANVSTAPRNHGQAANGAA